MIEPQNVGRDAPEIFLCEADHDRLTDLATAALPRLPEVATLLLDELDRAVVVADAGTAPLAAGIGSYVEYHDSEADTVQRVQIVYPSEADIAQWRISVLTLVGAGLIGLSAGQSIRWPTRDGRARVLTVLRVERDAFEGGATVQSAS